MGRAINTNTRAKKMYEKHGFNKEKEKKYGFLTKRAGFTSVFICVKSFDKIVYAKR